jgi:hypothetical protein
VVQNEENTRDGDFLVKSLERAAGKAWQGRVSKASRFASSRDGKARTLRLRRLESKIWSTHNVFVEVEALG